MRTNILPLSIFIALAAPLASNAQEFPYTLTSLTEAYQNLDNPTSLIAEEVWDDPEFVVPIGFDFTFFGNAITELQMTSSGSELNSPYVGGTFNLMIPYLADVMNASETEVVSEINYQVDGEEGSRIVKVEWKNVGFYDEFAANGTFNNITNFQLWIYETDNSFDFRFGPNTIKEGMLIHEFGSPTCILGYDLGVSGTTWGGIWSIGGEPSDPSVVVFDPLSGAITQEGLLNFEPPSGTVFHFGPATVTSTVEITDEEDTNSLQVYPNPASDEVRIFGAPSEKFEIYDMVGKMIWNGRLTNDVTALDVSQWQDGIYIIRTESGQIQRIVKRK